MGIKIGHRPGVADLHQDEGVNGVQGGNGTAPGVQLVGVVGVVDDDARRHPPPSRTDAGRLDDLIRVGGLGEGHADDGIARNQSPARLIECELGGGGGLQGAGAAHGALDGVNGLGALLQDGRRPLPHRLHIRARPTGGQGGEARGLTLMQSAGGELGQAMAPGPGNVGQQGGVSVARGP